MKYSVKAVRVPVDVRILKEDGRGEQSRAEQSRGEQRRGEQRRAEESRAEQSRAEQSRAEQRRAQTSSDAWSKPQTCLLYIADLVHIGEDGLGSDSEWPAPVRGSGDADEGVAWVGTAERSKGTQE
jgi:hypothetical protein